MYTAEVDYYRATSVADAVKALHKNKDAKLLAGGHSLIPSMKLRVAQPALLVDIGHIAKLSGIKAGKNDITIGALTTHAAVAASEEIKAACPILAEAAALIADTQVRNRGTIGGSLANADPASDYPTLITALDATLTVVGPKGEREIEAKKFFKDLFTTSLKRDEVLTSVTVPAYGKMPGMGGAYLKHRHPASSYAVVGVAGMIGVMDGKVGRAVVVVGGATANPVHARAVEAALAGMEPTAENIAAAAEKMDIEATMGDPYASAEYRAHLAKVMAKRALMLAAERAGG
ncbi:MAG TPA: xanthine dehydrogenase family protein subunit M [Anaerolineales bacterium]|nr:xanthine dehydrogenase family protein subunit M [Anaerolineales bacterium]